MYGVGFIYLASQWTKTADGNAAVLAAGNNMRAAITFSFFSVFTWVTELIIFFLITHNSTIVQHLFNK